MAKLLLFLGIALFATGLASLSGWFVWMAWLEAGFPAAALAVAVVGFMIAFFGLMAYDI